jgi:protein O-GlcNAc transferase
MPRTPRPSAARAGTRAPPRRGAGAWLAQVQYLTEHGHVDGAAVLLDGLLDDRPRSVDLLYWRTMVSLGNERSAASTVHWAERLTEIAPGVARHQWLLGRAFKASGRLGDAIAAYRKALEIKPDFTDGWVSLGIAYRAASQLDEAIASYRLALRIEADHALAHANLGNALAERDYAVNILSPVDVATEGLDVQRHALSLDPGNAQLHANLAASLEQLSRLDEAIERFNQALGIDPQRQDWLLRMGGCLIKQRKPLLAVAAYEKWMDRHPDSGVVASNIAHALLEANDPSRASDWADKAIDLQPDFGGGFLSRGSVRLKSGQVPAAIGDFRRAMELSPHIKASALSGMLMALTYVEQDGQMLLAAHREYGELFPPPSVPLPAARARHGRKLRVGFVSADFKQHSVAWFFETLMQNFDESRFEFICYHNTFTNDVATERIRARATDWVDCFSMSDLALHYRIGQDRIDILVDLSGHTQGHRLAVFAARAAPVQITYLGYPTTTGMKEIDFRITDAVIDPPNEQSMNVESPLRCAQSMFCYRADVAPEVGRPPCARTGLITFGSFNNINKLSERTLELWSGVLHALPSSQLFLKTSALALERARADLAERLAARGIDPARLRFDPWRPDKVSHLELYREVDIALDTFPYNGATTTCEALWMGVPVVTLRGPTHVSRMGASILAAACHPDWVAESPVQFTALAVALAADPERLAGIRECARQDLADSALMDAPRFTRDFERLLDEAWALRAEPEHALFA